MRANRPHLTEAEFDELKRTRDEAVAAIVKSISEHYGWDLSKVLFHCSPHPGTCYCACPNGPCQHEWNGEPVSDEHSWSVTCARCGMSATSHDLRCCP
jgi:hypothetical protein